MLRLPNKFHARGWFSLVAFFGSAGLWTLHRSAIYSFQPSVVLSSFIPSLVFGIPAAIIALICWPKKSSRTKKRMALAGLAVVFFTFLLVAVLMGLLVIVQRGPYANFHYAAKSFYSGLTAMNINTLGVPYVIAAMLSQIFVEGDN